LDIMLRVRKMAKAKRKIPIRKQVVSPLTSCRNERICLNENLGDLLFFF